MIIPMEPEQNLQAQIIAKEFRTAADISVATDISTKKVGKKIGDAAERLVDYILVVGENEIKSGVYTLKNLNEEKHASGTIEELVQIFKA
jgi:histidyl-tRNA synthetase